MAEFAAQRGAFRMSVLATGAQTAVLQAVDVKRQAKRIAEMASRVKREIG